MKFVIAPDKFKGTFTAAEVAAAVAAGVREVYPDADVVPCPMADGGEGTVAAFGGTPVTRRVVGPLPEMTVDAVFTMLGDGTAVIESAAASGLALVPPADRDPLAATSFGTGQLVAAAIELGATRIVLGLGGTATVDSGMGLLQACRFSILTTDGRPISPTEPLTARDLDRVLAVKRGRGEITAGIEIVVACDAMIQLLGPNGAARLFGPQKGASPATVEWLEGQLARLSAGSAAADLPGAGAAGGIGFAAAAFARGMLRSGFEVVADRVGLGETLDGAAACVTGEGRLDAGSAVGKVVAGVARLCHARGVPCIAVVGSMDPDVSVDGLTAVIPAGPSATLAQIHAAIVAGLTRNRFGDAKAACSYPPMPQNISVFS